MQTSTRKLKERELKELNGFVSPLTLFGRGVLFLLAGIPVGVVFAGFNYASAQIADFVWWPFATVIVLIALYVYSKRWTGGPGLRDAIRSDIAGGLAQDRSFHVKRALKFHEIEDEGHVFVIEDEDGSAYCFSSQDLPRTFPKQNVVASEAPKSLIRFAVRMSGDRLKSEMATISFDESAFFYSDVAQRDQMGVALNATFQDVLDQTPH